jgi:hypothetical protein
MDQTAGHSPADQQYTSEHHGRRASRTSLWRRTEVGQWQVFHHQGTLTAR